MPLTGDGQFLDLQYFLGLLVQLLHVLDFFLLEGKSNVAQQFLILQFLVEESGPQLRNFLLGLVNFLLKLFPLSLIFSVAALRPKSISRANLLDHVMYRMGVLAVLRSKLKKGNRFKYVTHGALICKIRYKMSIIWVDSLPIYSLESVSTKYAWACPYS